VVVTSLGEDHLDWHGTVAQYHADKLALTRASGDHVTLVPDDDSVLAERAQIGGEIRSVAPENEELTERLHLIGRHNASDVALAVASVGAATDRPTSTVRSSLSDQADAFVPLPGRLAIVATLDGVRYVDDGLATAPLPTIAALEAFSDVSVSLIVGGFDRGVEYESLMSALAARWTTTTLICLPGAGERVAQLAKGHSFPTHRVADLAEAVAEAHRRTPRGGVVLFSPAAPSFDRYRDWKERSEDFRRCVVALEAPS
jgi:UDP-N-acetylmuramoylalanine--D-glutamate ligase